VRDDSPPPLRPAALPRCVFFSFSFLAVFFSFLSGIENEKRKNVCRFVFHARVCVAKVLGSVVVEFLGFWKLYGYH
jgi:hypothetical protein